MPVPDFYTDLENIKKYNIKDIDRKVFYDKYQNALIISIKTDFDLADNRFKLFTDAEKQREIKKEIENTNERLNELKERLEYGRDYLISKETKEIQVKEALKAFGFANKAGAYF